MPNWVQVLQEIQGTKVDNPLDSVRRKYLSIMNKYTDRNVIAYYSGFLQKPGGNVAIDDNDKNALMQAVHGLDKSKGLDLLLHTPGGNTAATESIVNYLRSIFGNNIRAFVPQIAMSAGTMIALSCNSIVMGKQSNIGPIDPQFGGMSCAAVIEEFDNALQSVSKNAASIPLWQVIISKYHPTFLGDCQKAIQWSQEIVKEWLCDNMLQGRDDADQISETIIQRLGSHQHTFSHERHIHIDECKNMGIRVVELESLDNREIDGCKDLQDCVLTIHHTYMHTFSNSTAVKIVENHLGSAMIMNMSQNLSMMPVNMK
ncbi:MAG: S49 family peptidase [Lachnospiraceae bacterium]|nr:S49 family peptidase [Lachnospiraceae bacterium]